MSTASLCPITRSTSPRNSSPTLPCEFSHAGKEGFTSRVFCTGRAATCHKMSSNSDICVEITGSRSVMVLCVDSGCCNCCRKLPTSSPRWLVEDSSSFVYFVTMIRSEQESDDREGQSQWLLLENRWITDFRTCMTKR